MNVVADACVAVKWYIREPGFEQAALLPDARADRIDLCAPDIFLAEMLNALARKVRAGQATDQQAQDALDHLRSLAVPLVPTPLLMDRALRLALRLDHAVPDCLYLACAEHNGAALVTADDHFLRKLKDFASPVPVVRLADVARFLAPLGPRPAS
ncbi:type II toxin-antitoxin system VapC family toxin [Methylobacterium nigriterrae]|uniref:type II toxin-antitoxin system VapC family toxin n=1 Tax=Methylobacterium nigriterrae TaxID=3127512 RepID=UPI003013F1FB